jgi:hypothetical protein
MITLILTPNALEPLRREIMQLEAAPGGSRLRSLLPPEWAEQLDHVIAFVDGRRVEDWDSKVEDEKTVLLGFSPSGGTVITLIGSPISPSSRTLTAPRPMASSGSRTPTRRKAKGSRLSTG